MKPVSQAGSNFSVAFLDASPPSSLWTTLASRYFSFFFFFLIFFRRLPFHLCFRFRHNYHLCDRSRHHLRIHLRLHLWPQASLFSSYVFSPVLSYNYSCMLLRRGEETNRLRLQDLHFLISSIPTSGLQPAAVMEALEGGSSSASTSCRLTKRNGMKRNEMRRETRQHLFARFLFASSLFPPFSSPSSLCVFWFAREKNVTHHVHA